MLALIEVNFPVLEGPVVIVGTTIKVVCRRGIAYLNKAMPPTTV
jgi:hypothetical protein